MMKPIVSEKVIVNPSGATYFRRFQYRISFSVSEGPESLEYLQNHFQPFEKEIKEFFNEYYKPCYCKMQEYFSQKQDEKFFVIQIEAIGRKSVFKSLQKFASTLKY